MMGSSYHSKVEVKGMCILFDWAGNTLEFIPRTDSTFYNYEKDITLLFGKSESKEVERVELLFTSGMRSKFTKVTGDKKEE